jgi:hypothetical protein
MVLFWHGKVFAVAAKQILDMDVARELGRYSCSGRPKTVSRQRLIPCPLRLFSDLSLSYAWEQIK